MGYRGSFALVNAAIRLASYVLRRLAKLVRLLSERVVEMSTLGVNNRIHAELLRLARAVDPESNCVTIQRMPTRKEFAARISCNEEAVSREWRPIGSARTARKPHDEPPRHSCSLWEAKDLGRPCARPGPSAAGASAARREQWLAVAALSCRLEYVSN